MALASIPPLMITASKRWPLTSGSPSSRREPNYLSIGIAIGLAVVSLF